MSRGVGETFLTKLLTEDILNDVIRDIILNGDNYLDVLLQDATTRAFDLPFHQNLGNTTLAADVARDDWEFTASDGHGIQVGEQIAMYDVAAEAGFGASTALVVDGDNITIDSPATANLAAATTIVARSNIEMAVDGSGARQTFAITNPFDTPEDITRIMFMMQLGGAPSLAKFGDQDALARGLVFRSTNSEYANYFNVKKNADFALIMYDLTFYTAAGFGQDGLAGRYSFAGTDKHGVVLRLGQGESLEMIVQDDLTDLQSFRIIAQGHETSGEVH